MRDPQTNNSTSWKKKVLHFISCFSFPKMFSRLEFALVMTSSNKKLMTSNRTWNWSEGMTTSGKLRFGVND